MKHFGKLAAVAAVVVLAGCAGRPMNQPAGPVTTSNPFDVALAEQYRGLSQVEKASGDNRDADAYALRAAAAASGNPTQPDEVALREPIFPDEYKAELNSERARLVSALDRNGRTVAPVDAARAQAMYDCWLEQSQENIQPEHIAACRDAYMTAIAKVEAALAAGPAPVMGALVFFDWNRSNLTVEGRDVVRNVTASAKSEGASRVVVTGYTDSSGSQEYNLALSGRRAASVKDAMVQMGIPAGAIRTIARGESDPLVPTGDGVREPQNRRAQIEIEK